MINEIKPCPFCGSTEAKLTKCHAEWGYGWHVTCNNCLSVGETAYSDRTGMMAKTPEEKGREMKARAVANWNRRAPSDHDGDATGMVDDNPPLTLEELRWMNGEPVYIADLSYGSLRTGWKIFDWHDDDCFFTHWKGMFRAGTYGVDWLAYRRKPEEEK